MPTKREVKVHGRIRWEVDFGKDPLTGDKKRRYCESESEADKAISDYDKEVKRNGEYWARLMPARRQLIVGVLLEMDKEGVELNTVWTDWKKEKKETPTVLEPALALDKAGLASWAEQLRRVFGEDSTPQWEAYAHSTFAALSAIVPPEKLRFMQYVTPQSKGWWEEHKNLGAVVQGAATNRNHELTEDEAMRKAKRRGAAKKAWVTIRANRAKQNSGGSASLS